MCQLFDLMISFYIHGQIGPVIIRYPELISIRIINPLRPVYEVLPDGRRIGSASAVSKIERHAESVGKPIIGNECKIMRLIVIAGIKISSIRSIRRVPVHSPQQGP
jgi:hypothetical protein